MEEEVGQSQPQPDKVQVLPQVYHHQDMTETGKHMTKYKKDI